MYKIHSENKNILIIEIHRKSIHLLGIMFPVVYHFVNRSTMIILISALLVSSVLIDKLRMKFDVMDYKLCKMINLSNMYREHEKTGYSALTFAFVGMIICLLISSKVIVNLSISIMTLSDSTAAICGILYGKTKVNGKSIEGSVAFFIVSCLLSYVITSIYNYNFKFLISAFLASLVVTIVELYSKNWKINDNMSISITVCVIINIMTHHYY